jgi:hypothetical protein
MCPLLAFLLVVWRRHQQHGGRERLLSKLPSSSGRLPIIEHLHLLDPIPQVKHHRDGLLLLRLGVVPTLVVSSPGTAQAINSVSIPRGE